VVDLEGNNEHGDYVSATNHYHGDSIPGFAVPAEVECHYVGDDGKRSDRVLIVMDARLFGLPLTMTFAPHQD
jgi:hypothetical protein